MVADFGHVAMSISHICSQRRDNDRSTNIGGDSDRATEKSEMATEKDERSPFLCRFLVMLSLSRVHFVVPSLSRQGSFCRSVAISGSFCRYVALQGSFCRSVGNSPYFCRSDAISLFGKKTRWPQSDMSEIGHHNFVLNNKIFSECVFSCPRVTSLHLTPFDPWQPDVVL